MKRLGYMDIYNALRSWHSQLHDLREAFRKDAEDSSKNALETLDGVFYLVEGQLVRDADGEN